MDRLFRNYATTRALGFGALVLLCFGLTSCGEGGPEQTAVSVSSRGDSLEAAILEAPNTPEPYHARAQYQSNQGNPQGDKGKKGQGKGKGKGRGGKRW